MNIIFISNQQYPVGMAGTKRIRLFAEYLANKNKTINVFIIANSNGENNNSGIKNKVKYKVFRYNILSLIFGNKFARRQIKSLFNKNCKNIIILYGGLSILTFKEISYASKMGYKIIADIVEDYSIHKENISFRLKLKYKLDNYITNKQFSAFSGVIVLSNYLKNKYQDIGINKENIILIPISADNLFHQYRTNNERKIFRFIYAGTFGNKDGIDLMLLSFNMLKKHYPNIELLLAGNISKYYRELINTYSDYDMKYVGLIQEEKFYDFLHDSDALLMTRIDSPYANSGFPFKLGEYLATGVPVIATDVSDISNYLIDNKEIILVDPSNKQALFESMEWVYLNKQKSIEIGENGKQVAAKFFNPNINGEMLHNFLKHI